MLKRVKQKQGAVDRGFTLQAAEQRDKDNILAHVYVCVCMCVCEQERVADNKAACEWSVFTLINYINTVRQLFRL